MDFQRRGVMLVLASPSGAGKSSISRALFGADPNIKLSVSVTTRGRRTDDTRAGVDADLLVACDGIGRAGAGNQQTAGTAEAVTNPRSRRAHCATVEDGYRCSVSEIERAAHRPARARP